MVRIAVVDDEKECSDMLVAFVDRYFSKTGEQYELTVFADGMDFVSSYKPCDIIFMDIRMKGLNGLDAAHTVRKMDGEVAIVFVTNMKDGKISGNGRARIHVEHRSRQSVRRRDITRGRRMEGIRLVRSRSEYPQKPLPRS